MNVLEMIASGIPSLISEEGFESWPELRDSLLVQVVNWDSKIEVDKAITSALNLSIEERRVATDKLLEVISIEQHVNRIIERSKRR
jgi:trehalose-6-phosphate synthase